jgi:hypothetical protein
LPPSAYAPAKIRLEIIDYTIKHIAGSDAFGALESAALRVRGRLWQGLWDIRKQTIESPPGLLALGNPRTITDRHDYAPTGPRRDATVSAWCLEIQDARHWVSRLHSQPGPALSGLLLVPYDDGYSTFQRVGLFNLANLFEHEKDGDVIAAALKNLSWFKDVEPRVITLI